MIDIGTVVRIDGPSNEDEKFCDGIEWTDEMYNFVGHKAVVSDIYDYEGKVVYSLGDCTYPGFVGDEWWFVDEWLTPECDLGDDDISHDIIQLLDMLN